MRVSSVSVPEVVREIITRNRSIYDCMKMDLINYTALAVKIQPEIEKILGNSVNLNTIVVAIKRYADSFEVKEEVKEEPVLKNARLALTDGIMDIKFSVKDSNEMDPMAILDKFSKITNNYEFFRYQIPLGSLQRTWMTLGRFSTMSLIGTKCSVLDWLKLESRFHHLRINQM